MLMAHRILAWPSISCSLAPKLSVWSSSSNFSSPYHQLSLTILYLYPVNHPIQYSCLKRLPVSTAHGLRLAATSVSAGFSYVPSLSSQSLKLQLATTSVATGFPHHPCWILSIFHSAVGDCNIWLESLSYDWPAVWRAGVIILWYLCIAWSCSFWNVRPFVRLSISSPLCITALLNSNNHRDASVGLSEVDPPPNTALQAPNFLCGYRHKVASEDWRSRCHYLWICYRHSRGHNSIVQRPWIYDGADTLNTLAYDMPIGSLFSGTGSTATRSDFNTRFGTWGEEKSTAHSL